jgi:nicotinamidase-related amidase
MKETLLLIDVQNNYFPSGKMELVYMRKAAKKAAELFKTFRTSDELVFSIKHLSKRPNTTFSIPELRE